MRDPSGACQRTQENQKKELEGDSQGSGQDVDVDELDDPLVDELDASLFLEPELEDDSLEEDVLLAASDSFLAPSL
jgi:hypothetical protein